MSDAPKLSVSGEDDFPVSVEALYSRLSDAGFLLGCFSAQIGEVIESSHDAARWKMKVPVPMMPGELEMALSFVERVENMSTRVRVEGSGLGGNAVVVTRNLIEPAEGGSRVKWNADVVEVGGTFMMIPNMMLEPGLRQAIAQSWDTLRENLDKEPGS